MPSPPPPFRPPRAGPPASPMLLPARYLSSSTTTKIGGLDTADFKTLVERAAPWSCSQGYQLLECSPGFLKVKLPFQDHFVGNISIPAMHGGVVASLIDHVAGFAAWTMLDSPAARVSTSELSISYLSPAPSTDLVGVGKVFSAGKKLIRVDVEVYAMRAQSIDESEAIAAGRGTFYKKERTAGSKEAEEEGQMFQGYLRSLRKE
mmetsp:Transcript_31619/g.62708  ORF Transcript_31619/g.62708 Transcript_31619/m.62708 type:complete len:205 (-) Transcript_31619:23-637(-)